MTAIESPCQACGWVFYGFGYAGEPCSAECDEVLRKTSPTARETDELRAVE
jgi:hypothetical protein